MAQLRLTDFFSRTKAAAGAPAKRGGRPRLKAAFAAPPVHREEEGEGAPAGLSAHPPPLPGSPRTPARVGSPAVRGLAGRKRSRGEMEPELGPGARAEAPGGKSARKRLEMHREAEPGPPAVVGSCWGRGCSATPTPGCGRKMGWEGRDGVGGSVKPGHRLRSSPRQGLDPASPGVGSPNPPQRLVLPF